MWGHGGVHGAGEWLTSGEWLRRIVVRQIEHQMPWVLVVRVMLRFGRRAFAAADAG
jgi:hypothetical protein